jgi:hypothetical protein
MMNETTRAYFEGRQKMEKGPLGDAMRAWLATKDDAAADAIEASESEVGLTRTRCVATRLFAGHADNALRAGDGNDQLPHLPGVDPNAIKADLQRIVADPKWW